MVDNRYTRDTIDIARDYAKYGLLFRRRDCPFCSCQMLMVRNIGNREQICWQCARCNILQGVTIKTPLCYMDIKLFDVSLCLWIDNVWPRLALHFVKNRSQVINYFQLIRKALSVYIKTKVLPYLVLPGPVEIDETRIGRQK